MAGGGRGSDPARVVACAFLVELTFLGGRARLGTTPVHVVLPYDD